MLKGIILAGGHGKRLYPITKVMSKQLLPIYNKPMIYYPLSTLMLSGIRDILIISTPKDINNYELLLGDGSDLGIKISYKIQDKPNGLAEAFIIGEKFIGNDDVCLVLGDNIFYGKDLPKILKSASNELVKNNESIIFGYNVKDPERYGVVSFDSKFNYKSLEEKPNLNTFILSGIYCLIKSVCNIVQQEFNDMPDLINLPQKLGFKIGIFPIYEYWNDIGTPKKFNSERKRHVKKT